jgi:type VI secretion system secreted protein VgrG
VQLKSIPFRAPLVRDKPFLGGVYVGLVVGPSGQELFTDEYGRIKVWFPWDRKGAKDDTACAMWVRVSHPIAGARWGFQAIPRIGQEVCVVFENGDPDRPVVMGSMYNYTNKPPYTPESTPTQVGWKSNSSTGGGGFHELVFEDLKGSEFVRFQSEKDYGVIVKNNATFSYGFEKAEPGDYTEKIKNHMTTEIESGNHTFTVKTGKEDYSVKQDRNLTVEGNENVTISKNKTDKITKDYTIDVGPNLTITAKSKITLECGGSKIEMTPQGVTITAPKIEQKADMQFKAEGGMQMELKGGMSLKAEGGMQMELKGGMMLKAEGGLMTEVKGGVLASVKGAFTMIG